MGQRVHVLLQLLEREERASEQRAERKTKNKNVEDVHKDFYCISSCEGNGTSSSVRSKAPELETEDKRSPRGTRHAHDVLDPMQGRLGVSSSQDVYITGPSRGATNLRCSTVITV